MRYSFFIIFILVSSNLSGQNLTDKVGQIEVQLILHHFIRNSDYELTKKISNRKNRPSRKLYFDSSGILLKTIGFGKQHNTDLRLMNGIEVYKYNDNKLIESIIYESDYQKNIYPYWKSKYLYNENGRLVDESKYYYENDSLFFKTTYEYDEKSNKVKTIFNPTYYYQREFDTINRIKSLQQIYDSKLRWEWKYTYSENKRLGVFQTYYNDGKDYSTKDVQTYNEKGFLIEKEEMYISKNGFDKKAKVFYDENGIIKRIEYFEANKDMEYSLISYSEVIIKSKVKISPEIALKINEQIDVK